jgi:hypothetical protein
MTGYETQKLYQHGSWAIPRAMTHGPGKNWAKKNFFKYINAFFNKYYKIFIA